MHSVTFYLKNGEASTYEGCVRVIYETSRRKYFIRYYGPSSCLHDAEHNADDVVGFMSGNPLNHPRFPVQ